MKVTVYGEEEKEPAGEDRSHDHDHGHGHDHSHEYEHSHDHDHGHRHEHSHDHGHSHHHASPSHIRDLIRGMDLPEEVKKNGELSMMLLPLQRPGLTDVRWVTYISMK